MDDNEPMDSALKAVQMMRMAMLASIVLYIVLAEFVGAKTATAPDKIIFYALTFVAVTTVAITMALRRLLIAPAAAVLATQSSDTAMVNRWRGGYIASYATSESIALFGLVLRFLGFTLSQVAPFYLAAFILLLMLAPQRPTNELS